MGTAETPGPNHSRPPYSEKVELSRRFDGEDATCYGSAYAGECRNMSQLVTVDDIRAAQRRIAGTAVRTGLYKVSADRLKTAGVPQLPFDLYVKAESEQPIRSFKLRGAYNRIAQLS